MTAPVFAIAQTLINDMRLALAVEPDESKVRALQEIIYQKTNTGANLVGIVVANVEEVAPTSQYWEHNLSDPSKVVFCSASTLDESLDYDALIVCGWLGATKMSKLLHAYVAPEIYVLVNQFERKWLRSAQSRSQRTRIRQSAALRKKLLNVTVDDVLTTAPVQESRVAEPTDGPDISEFELRLRFYRRQAMATEHVENEQTVQARLVELSDNYFVFLTESYHVPVVTAYLAGSFVTEEIPQRTVTKIRAGDFLLFRESAEGDFDYILCLDKFENTARLSLRQDTQDFFLAHNTTTTSRTGRSSVTSRFRRLLVRGTTIRSQERSTSSRIRGQSLY